MTLTVSVATNSPALPLRASVPATVSTTESPALIPDNWLFANVATYVVPSLDNAPDIAAAPFSVIPPTVHCDRSKPGAIVMYAVTVPLPVRRLIDCGAMLTDTGGTQRPLAPPSTASTHSDMRMTPVAGLVGHARTPTWFTPAFDQSHTPA